MEDILYKICENKRLLLKQKGAFLGHIPPKFRIHPLIKPSINEAIFICEIKKKSPSLGSINTTSNIEEICSSYIQSGGNVISILCEEEYFNGSLKDLVRIKSTFKNTCILRKDFILEKEEIKASYLFGADMILLIAAIFMQDLKKLQELVDEIRAYNLTLLLEVHTKEEIDLILKLDLKDIDFIVGINSRNLKSLEINKIYALSLKAYLPKHFRVIFESGISTSYDGFIIASSGFNGFLCGSYLMQNTNALESKDINKISNKDIGHFFNEDTNILKNLISCFKSGSKTSFFAKLFMLKGLHSKSLLKICGVNSVEFFKSASKKADLLGFILTTKSTRHVDLKLLQEIRHIKSNALKVGVVLEDESFKLGLKALELGLIDCLQLHNSKSLEYLRMPLKEARFSFYQAFNLLKEDKEECSFSFEEILKMNIFSFALLDSNKNSNSPLQVEHLKNKPLSLIALAGGINKINLSSFLELKPFLIDICKGCEEDGAKSYENLEEISKIFTLKSHKKDELFCEEYNQKFEFNSKVADVFDDMIKRSIPYYEEILSLSKKIILKNLKSTLKLVDIGSSTGNFIFSLEKDLKDIKTLKKVELLGIDSSSSMIAKSLIKAKNLESKAKFILANFLEYDFKDAEVILANYILQFIRPINRQEALIKIYSSLKEGGIFILAEKILSTSPTFDVQITELYYEYKKSSGYSNTEIYKKRQALENVLIPYSLKENIKMLEDAGFKDVEVLFLWVNFALFICKK